MSTSNAFATVEALRIVLREEQPPAMAEVLCDMERARMTAEDYRGAVLSPYPAGCNTADGHLRLRTWKEFGKERNQRCDHVTFNVIEPATEALDQMCSDMRTKLTATGSTSQPLYKALETAHNEICRIQSILREEDTSDDDDEMETETESNTVRVPRTSFCEVCDNYWDERTVVWYDRPFAHEGRNLYSACYRCRSQMGHNFEHINVNFIVDARRATDGTNREMESESDQESDTRQSAR